MTLEYDTPGTWVSMLAVLVCKFGLDLACYSNVVPYPSLTLLWSWLLPRSTEGNMLAHNFHNIRNSTTTNVMYSQRRKLAQALRV